MSSDIGFSGPGPPDLSSRNSGDNDNDSDSVAVPVFFNRSNPEPEEEISIETVETAKEAAMRSHSIQSVPKV